MMNECPKCGSKKMIETISGGITQRILWDGDWVLREETTYAKTLKFSVYNCAECGCEIPKDSKPKKNASGLLILEGIKHRKGRK